MGERILFVYLHQKSFPFLSVQSSVQFESSPFSYLPPNAATRVVCVVAGKGEGGGGWMPE